MFNNIFHTYCLNLDRREDRMVKSQMIFDTLCINAERFSAVDGKNIPNITNLKPGEYAIILSYARILEDAIKKNYPAICILEDDCEFCDNFNEIFNQVYNIIPDNWHYINFGPNLYSKRFSRINNSNVIKIEDCFATHAIALRREIYECVKNAIIKLYAPLDVLISKEVFPLYNIYGFNPALIWQRNDYSDIQEMNIDYSFLRNKL